MGMQQMKRLMMIAVVLLSLIGTAMAQTAYNVTITNMTANQVFTPILVVSHSPAVSLFQVGEAASAELEQIAEGGDTAPLTAVLEASGATADIQNLPDLLSPGQSMTVALMTVEGMNYISVVGMLIPTNDAFVALNGALAPETSARFRVPAYDAGTEVNDENCLNIPGPVCGGDGFIEGREGAEGFVHIHRGIHGIMDLTASVYDWRNPVAQITIELAE